MKDLLRQQALNHYPLQDEDRKMPRFDCLNRLTKGKKTLQ
jgi:hypothetical protein